MQKVLFSCPRLIFFSLWELVSPLSLFDFKFYLNAAQKHRRTGRISAAFLSSAYDFAILTWRKRETFNISKHASMKNSVYIFVLPWNLFYQLKSSLKSFYPPGKVCYFSCLVKISQFPSNVTRWRYVLPNVVLFSRIEKAGKVIVRSYLKTERRKICTVDKMENILINQI